MKTNKPSLYFIVMSHIVNICFGSIVGTIGGFFIGFFIWKNLMLSLMLAGVSNFIIITYMGAGAIYSEMRK